MLLLTIDENNRKPKYQQILEQIRHKIESHTLRPGEKLPSTRRLAEKLNIHRSTVAIAYQELWSLGFIDLHPGACPRIRQRMKMATPASRCEKSAIDWHKISSPAAQTILQTYQNFQTKPDKGKNIPIINFSSLDMDSRLFPMENFASCLTRGLKNQGVSLLGYGDHAGFPPLREYTARHLQKHGISVTPGEILITSGSQQAIDLVFRMLGGGKKTVAIESPTYDYMLPILHFNQLTPIEIPLRHDGLDLDQLEKVIETEHPVLIYTMPNFQNPTGVTTTQAHRERLLSISAKHRIPILEDGFEEEMKYFGNVVLPIKSMDIHHQVIYCGTFSKVLFPGVRIGWVAAAGECIERLMAIRRFSELSSSMILQAAMHEFCRNGYYHRHVSKMHRVFRKRMQTITRALLLHIDPEWAEWTEPHGGYLVWLKLKKTTSPDWKNLLAEHGLQAALGKYFFSSNNPETYLRLSISTLNEEEITEGIKRLAKTLKHLYSSPN